MEESVHSRKRSALAVLEFFMPGHLDGCELGFIGSGGIAGEAGEFGDPFVHVGEAHGEGIDVREFVGQTDGDVLKIVPTECRRHVHSEKRFNTEGTKIEKKRLRDKPAAKTESMIEFLGVILVPIGNFDDDVGGAIRHGLATEARLRRDAGVFIKLSELCLCVFTEGFYAFSDVTDARDASS